MARQLNNWLKKYLAEALVSEEKEEGFIRAFYRHPQLRSVSWTRTRRSWMLSTPYGRLDVCDDLQRCRRVEREGVPLVHLSNGKQTVFRSVKAAKVAAICHAPDGFQGSSVTDDGCHWRLPYSICPPIIEVDEADPDETLSDEYEIEPDALNAHLEEFVGLRLAADLQILADLRAKERLWALKAPNWSNPTKGQHFLATPRGVLSVQRFLLGWVIKRNDELLNWLRHKGPIVFGNLASAKVAALVHMHGLEKERFMDSTYWALSDCAT